MYQLPTDTVTRWHLLGHTSKLVPFSLNGPCPNSDCGRSPVTFYFGRNWNDRGSFQSVQSKCPSCEKAARFFLLDSPRTESEPPYDSARLYIDPTPPLLDSVSKEVADTSSRFAETYRQARMAEGQGLDMLVGMGFRKALEFLVKDYLSTRNPGEAETIQSKHLGQVIAEHVQDQRIKDCARMAAWLGNDETHYVRKWIDKDLRDLKLLMELTVHWISMELLTKQYRSDMLD